MNWFKQGVDRAYVKVLMVYLLGFMALTTGAWIGFLGPVLVSAGWVGKAVGFLVLTHVVLTFYVLYKTSKDKSYIIYGDVNDMTHGQAADLRGRRNRYKAANGLLSWLDKIDTSILAVGFLGKLYGIAQVLASVTTAGDAAAAAASLGAISHGVSVALFSTMMGLGLSLWTHCATLIVSNRLNSLRE